MCAILRSLKAILESDPTAYVLSANVHRRHLTKGQQAMAVALAKPEPEKGKRNDLLNNSTGLDFDKASLSRARFVLRNCRDKAEQVRIPHLFHRLK